MRQSHLIVQTFKYTNIIILMVMELKMATRKFNGETLHLVGNPVSTKSEAQKIAKTYRKLGYLARVVDLDYGYGVFVKEKLYRTDKLGNTVRITR